MNKKISLQVWILLGSLFVSIVAHYFISQMKTTEGFANSSVATAEVKNETEKNRIEIENLKIMNAIYERDKQNMRNEMKDAISKFESKLDKIFDVLLKDKNK